MDVFLQPDLKVDWSEIMKVSILVLVDVFLQLSVAERKRTVPECFNPCFSGCLSSTNNKVKGD